MKNNKANYFVCSFVFKKKKKKKKYHAQIINYDYSLVYLLLQRERESACTRYAMVKGSPGLSGCASFAGLSSACS